MSVGPGVTLVGWKRRVVSVLDVVRVRNGSSCVSSSEEDAGSKEWSDGQRTCWQGCLSWGSGGSCKE